MRKRKQNDHEEESTSSLGLIARLSIRHKLVLIIMLVSSAAMVVAGGAFITHEWFFFRKSMVSDLSAQAEMLASNCTGALTFDDPYDATDVLDSLRARPAILAACVYRPNGSVFAAYPQDKLHSEMWPTPQLDNYRFDDHGLVMFKYVKLDGQIIGSVYLRLDLRELNDFLNQSIVTLALTIAFSSIAVYVLSAKLQQLVSKPIFHLVETARIISQYKDYSVRAVKQSEDELGLLTDAFNNMLVQVEKRDSALRESEARFRTVVDQAADTMIVHDRQGRLMDVNRRACESLGYTREELLAMCMKDIELRIEGMDPEDNWSRMTPSQPLTVTGSHKRKDGTSFPVELRLGLLELESQTAILALARDITDRKQAEEEMNQLRNYLKNIIDSMPSILVGVDKEGRVTLWNSEAERVTGVPLRESLGQSLAEVLPQLVLGEERIRQAIRERKPQKKEKVPTRENGEMRYSDVTVYPLVSSGVEGAVIRVDDVTTRVRIEEMMIQSEKMLSVGGLAAGMAHEINNPLAGILQNAQVMSNRVSKNLPKNDQAARDCGTTLAAVRAYMEKRGLISMVEAIMESGLRAAQIVDNMLSFSRKNSTGNLPNDLGVLLDKALDLASNDYDLKRKYDFRRIKIIREYDPSMPNVPCGDSKIQQVFLNILKNGAQAMAEKRLLRDSGDEEGAHFILRVFPEGEMARIEIEDNGPGMDKTTSKRIFEPFFTTKGVGLGTGLGLSISYFIISENHRGTMAVESTPGQGSKFIIRLPLHKQAPIGDRSSPALPTRPHNPGRGSSQRL